MRKDFQSAYTKRRIAVIGLGGAGKTTLLRSLTGCDAIDPRISNSGVTPIVVRYQEKRGFLASTRVHNYLLLDCEGQDYTKWSIALATAPQTSLFELGNFDAVLFVVDVVEPHNPNFTPAMNDEIDFNRIGLHTTEWSNTALDFVFAHLGGRLNYAAVFINKVNLVRSANKEHVLMAFDPLIARIRSRCRGFLFQTFVGNASESSEGETEELAELRDQIFVTQDEIARQNEFHKLEHVGER